MIRASVTGHPPGDGCTGKGQTIRLLDVLVLGPFMMCFGAAARSMSPWSRAAMVLAGLATILFNGINYLRIESARTCRQGYTLGRAT